MKRLVAHIVGFIALLLGFTVCDHKDLTPCPVTGDVPVNVIIRWDSVPSDMLALPRDMTVHWYPASSSIIASDISVYGGREWLYADIYDVMCMDFNGPTTLSFRSNGKREDFEVYNVRMTGTYNSLVPQLPGGEVTVAEAYPYQFYIDSRSQTIDAKNVLAGDTLTVNFYPKNVLREFTFLVYDVIGAQHMTKSGGAMSGMSGSYFPASHELASTPSTILFSRTETIRDAQTSPRWTEKEKALFTAKNPNWTSSDTLIGWTRDWVIGKFVTFGPLDREQNRFRLTVEAFTQMNNQYHGSWGYWHGQWENTVAAQIDGALGQNGTWEEQLAWRQRNGGYDIVLFNDHRLAILEGDGGDPRLTDGGFTVNVDDWGDIISVPVAGAGTSHAVETLRATSLQKAPVNTYKTIPDFVINGIYSGDQSFIFHEQYVYKPEVGNIWDYYPKKYWPQSGEVDFYAYAPAGLTNLVTGLAPDVTPPVLEYAMLSPENRNEPPCGTGEPCNDLWVGDQVDLLVAVQNRMAPQTDPVPMNFYHAFSRVTVTAKTDVDYSIPDMNGNYRRIKVTRVDLRNLNTHGKLELSKDDIPMVQGGSFTSGATLWDILGDMASYRFRLIGPVVTVESDYTTLIDSNDWILVMPQITAGNTAIYVEYDVYTYSLTTSDEQYDESVTKLLPLAGFTFGIGQQYELQITLNAP